MNPARSLRNSTSPVLLALVALLVAAVATFMPSAPSGAASACNATLGTVTTSPTGGGSTAGYGSLVDVSFAGSIPDPNSACSGVGNELVIGVPPELTPPTGASYTLFAPDGTTVVGTMAVPASAPGTVIITFDPAYLASHQHVQFNAFLSMTVSTSAAQGHDTLTWTTLTGSATSTLDVGGSCAPNCALPTNPYKYTGYNPGDGSSNNLPYVSSGITSPALSAPSVVAISDTYDAGSQLQCTGNLAPYVWVGTSVDPVTGYLIWDHQLDASSYTLACNQATNTVSVTIPAASTQAGGAYVLSSSALVTLPTLPTFDDHGSVQIDTDAPTTVTASATKYSGGGGGSGNTAYAIGDYVWLDANANGVQDSGELPVQGATVTLTDGSGNPVTDLAGNPVAPVATDANGAYHFDDLAAGSYVVSFTPPAGYAFTTQNTGSDQAVDSNADTTTGRSAVVALGPSDANLTASVPFDLVTAPLIDRTVDAGFVPRYAIGDYVFLDANANGVQDAGDTPVQNVTVTLRDSGGATVATTTTDANGAYHFDDLLAGDYRVDFTAPAGYSFTSQTAGSDTTVDSNPNASGISATLTLGPSDTNLTPSVPFDLVTAPFIDRTIDAGLTLSPSNPSVRVEKYDGTKSFTPNGAVATAVKDTDAPLGDAESPATALSVVGTDPTPVKVTLNNNGDVPLYDVTVADQTIAGTGTVTGLSCTFPDSSTGLFFAGPLVPGAVVTCTGTLPALGDSATHEDQVTIFGRAGLLTAGVPTPDPTNPPTGQPITGPGTGIVTDTDLFNVDTPAATTTTTTTTTTIPDTTTTTIPDTTTTTVPDTTTTTIPDTTTTTIPDTTTTTVPDTTTTTVPDTTTTTVPDTTTTTTVPDRTTTTVPATTTTTAPQTTTTTTVPATTTTTVPGTTTTTLPGTTTTTVLGTTTVPVTTTTALPATTSTSVVATTSPGSTTTVPPRPPVTTGPTLPPAPPASTPAGPVLPVTTVGPAPTTGAETDAADTVATIVPVTSSDVSSVDLPRTGADLWPLLWLGMASLLSGLVLILTGRRRLLDARR